MESSSITQGAQARKIFLRKKEKKERKKQKKGKRQIAPACGVQPSTEDFIRHFPQGPTQATPNQCQLFSPGIVLTTLQRVSIKGTEEAQRCSRAIERLLHPGFNAQQFREENQKNSSE